ncbi:hypothetical protein BKA70DRAFT_1442404 [Coprinopsis sp. MPI-PUGE-AT-0042]|nr:hypothetical protein BKA70DRAFT_1442404 [Coprinopsis sp. MPI-PUGE-AT-0042]
MASAFSIKYRKTQGGPPNEDVVFEFVDNTNGVERRLHWQNVLGFGDFIYRTGATEVATNPVSGNSVLDGSLATSTSQDVPLQPSSSPA